MEGKSKYNAPKYIRKDTNSENSHWNICSQFKLPFITISKSDDEFDTISYDILPCLPFDKISTDLVESISNIYNSYNDFFNIPDNKVSLAGGTNALSINVKNNHSDFIAENLFDFLIEYIKKNKTPIK